MPIKKVIEDTKLLQSTEEFTLLIFTFVTFVQIEILSSDLTFALFPY